jgi:hypothetical protein
VSTAAKTPRVTIDELVLADDAQRWADLGFAVDSDATIIGAVRIRFAGRDAGHGLLSWSLRGISSTELDGVATTRSDSDERAPSEPHPNGVAAIDHVVAFSPQLDRTVAALEAAGLDLRRIREEPTPAGAPRQAFFRLGGEILEVIQQPRDTIAAGGGADAPAGLWGLAFIVGDIDATVAALAPHAGDARDAVQEGRRIATLKRTARVAVPVAFMTPR